MAIMNTTGNFINPRRSHESGQAALFLLLALGLFLLGGIGLAVDMADLWMHRQASQNAADAACAAAALDLVNYSNGAPNTSGFTPGSAFNCSSNSTAAPCQYAGFNGYSATGLTANSPSTEVAISFPASVQGVQSCAGSPGPAVCAQAGFPTPAFVRATVTDRMRTFLVGLVSGRTTMDVGAVASCGAVLSNAVPPLLALDPTSSNTFDLGHGNGPTIKIYGGPARSIQINSSHPRAVNGQPNLVVDLSQGGPSLSGSDIGVTGGPSSPNFNYQGSPPGQYLDPITPMSDPFAMLPVPQRPAANGTITAVPTGINGCPASPCKEYSAGYYPNGINVGNFTAIFDPGVYYLDADFAAGPNSCLRPSTVVGDGSGGTFFYFNNGSTINIDQHSGRVPQGCPPGGISTTTRTGAGQLQFGAKCTAGSALTNLPANISGNLLLAPCSGPYGDPLLANDPLGEQHGILFFSDRSAAVGTQPSLGNGGTAALLGSLYFHYCNSADGPGLGTHCSSSAYSDRLTLAGNGSTLHVVGSIVTDQFDMGNGGIQIVMDLNPNAVYYVMKASLLQ